MDKKILQALTEFLGSEEEAIARYDVMVAEQEQADREFEKKRYINTRVNSYPSIGDQLDMIYHAGLGGDEFQAAIKAVKDAHPKSTGE